MAAVTSAHGATGETIKLITVGLLLLSLSSSSSSVTHAFLPPDEGFSSLGSPGAKNRKAVAEQTLCRINHRSLSSRSRRQRRRAAPDRAHSLRQLIDTRGGEFCGRMNIRFDSSEKNPLINSIVSRMSMRLSTAAEQRELRLRDHFAQANLLRKVRSDLCIDVSTSHVGVGAHALVFLLRFRGTEGVHRTCSRRSELLQRRKIDWSHRFSCVLIRVRSLRSTILISFPF